MLLGAHVSIAGGVDKAIERGVSIGAGAIQTFASPPRTLVFTSFPAEVVERYKTLKVKSSIKFHVFHGVYLLNLANEKSDYVQASVASLAAYQQAAAQIGALGTIFHVGSHKGAGFESVKHRVAEAIHQVLVQSPPETVLMLENAAGHNGTIGQTLEELAELLDLTCTLGCERDQLGVCLDTQHAFASGINARDQEVLENFLNRIKSLIGIDMIKVIHINDSKTACNSHRDRHENIGEGELGTAGLSNWLKHPLLQELPFVLEVPGHDGKGPGQSDIKLLKELHDTAR